MSLLVSYVICSFDSSFFCPFYPLLLFLPSWLFLFFHSILYTPSLSSPSPSPVAPPSPLSISSFLLSSLFLPPSHLLSLSLSLSPFSFLLPSLPE